MAPHRPVVHFEATGFQDLSPGTLHDLLKLRSDVFILEQGITTEADVDGLDPDAVHVVGRTNGGRLVATARVRPVAGGLEFKVERIVVDSAFRGQGVGSRLMDSVHALLGKARGTLSAQAHLCPWYEARGWRGEGDVYDEGGVPHRRMARAVGVHPPSASPDVGSNPCL